MHRTRKSKNKERVAEKRPLNIAKTLLYPYKSLKCWRTIRERETEEGSRLRWTRAPKGGKRLKRGRVRFDENKNSAGGTWQRRPALQPVFQRGAPILWGQIKSSSWLGSIWLQRFMFSCWNTDVWVGVAPWAHTALNSRSKNGRPVTSAAASARAASAVGPRLEGERRPLPSSAAGSPPPRAA